jgi:hypothetical protein
MEIAGQKNIEVERKERYDTWAKEWEGEMTRGQLTHIQNNPVVEMFVNEGKMAIPYILCKLQENRLWYIPLEVIALNEFGDEIVPDKIDQTNIPVSEDPIEAKFSYLEGHRTACIEWARDNGYLRREC